MNRLMMLFKHSENNNYLFFIRRLRRGLNETDINLFMTKLGTLVRPQNLGWTEEIIASLNKTEKIVREMGYLSADLMLEVMQPCEHLFKTCRWLGVIRNCDTLFRVTKSSQGYCCSFNYKTLNATMSG